PADPSEHMREVDEQRHDARDGGPRGGIDCAPTAAAPSDSAPAGPTGGFGVAVAADAAGDGHSSAHPRARTPGRRTKEPSCARDSAACSDTPPGGGTEPVHTGDPLVPRASEVASRGRSERYGPWPGSVS